MFNFERVPCTPDVSRNSTKRLSDFHSKSYYSFFIYFFSVAILNLIDLPFDNDFAIWIPWEKLIGISCNSTGVTFLNFLLWWNKLEKRCWIYMIY